MPSFLKIAKDSKNPVLNEWAIIGKGDLGSKAEDLMLRAVQIRKAGFQTSSRQVYTTDTYFSFLEHNGVFSAMDSGARPAALRKLIISGTFTDSEMHDIHNTAATFQTPLVVRSSAYGDSRGTGS
ncbi:hypothetical protein KJ780_01910, partial [Candidatus Micrarchaeota archaeon]|nr:hypothetical protein [Candidatus Micrarchaeota archaeon]